VDKIRFLKSGKKKRKSTGKATAVKGKKATNTSTTSATTPKAKKRKSTGNADTPKTAKKKKTSTTKGSSKKADYIPDPAGLHLAAEMGLPEGWTASARSKSRFVFLCPEGKERFASKKAVFAHLGEEPPSSSSKSEAKKKVKESTDVVVPAAIEGDDPPWRTDGHEYLQKRVKYEVTRGEFASGTVTGWISAEDTDTEGNPGFVSEKDGEPAALFHVTFDSSSAIASQDLEEFELVDSFVDEES